VDAPRDLLDAAPRAVVVRRFDVVDFVERDDPDDALDFPLDFAFDLDDADRFVVVDFPAALDFLPDLPADLPPDLRDAMGDSFGATRAVSMAARGFEVSDAAGVVATLKKR
jgi:hypothetical protein